MAKDKDFVQSVFDKADELRENKAGVLKQIDGNRTLMRSLWQSGMLSDDQVHEAFERYPTLGGRQLAYDAESQTFYNVDPDTKERTPIDASQAATVAGDGDGES